MKFEKSIMSIIHAVLEDIESAYFFDGSLFINCDEPVARTIYHTLSKETNSKIVVSKAICQTEYVFDFA
jgi:phage major head subunit gpT-like protein